MADVYAVSIAGDDVLSDTLVAVRFADDTVAPIWTDANGHLRLLRVPEGAIRLEDPFDAAR